MNNHFRSWKVLSWNVRGSNAEKKWNSIRDKISEATCDVVCLQETKRSFFDIKLSRNSVLHTLIASVSSHLMGLLGAL